MPWQETVLGKLSIRRKKNKLDAYLPKLTKLNSVISSSKCREKNYEYISRKYRSLLFNVRIGIRQKIHTIQHKSHKELINKFNCYI